MSLPAMTSLSVAQSSSSSNSHIHRVMMKNPITFHIFSLFNLPFLHIVHILPLFDLPFFHIISLFNILFSCIFQNKWCPIKMFIVLIVKRYGKYGRKPSWIVKRYGKCRRKVGWIVKWYGKYGRKASWIVKWYGKYGRFLC
jgi:hypothetical protein